MGIGTSPRSPGKLCPFSPQMADETSITRTPKRHEGMMSSNRISLSRGHDKVIISVNVENEAVSKGQDPEPLTAHMRETKVSGSGTIFGAFPKSNAQGHT